MLHVIFRLNLNKLCKCSTINFFCQGILNQFCEYVTNWIIFQLKHMDLDNVMQRFYKSEFRLKNVSQCDRI